MGGLPVDDLLNRFVCGTLGNQSLDAGANRLPDCIARLIDQSKRMIGCIHAIALCDVILHQD
ncbi:MAG: hypothetical protein HC898_12605 [Phycisphaerales bacterium]|nr:hypothetical protein [Phycisphaerales bacterium]